MPTFNLAAEAASQGSFWCGSVALTLHAWEEMGLKRSTVTYNRFAAALNKGANWQLARSALGRSMAEHDCIADVVSLNTALIACGESSSWQAATHLLSRAHEIQGNFSPITAGTLAAVCQKCRRWRISSWSLAALRRSQVELNIVTQTTMVATLASDRCWWNILQLIADMHAQDVSADDTFTGAAAAALRACAPWASCLGLAGALRQRKGDTKVAGLLGKSWPMAMDYHERCRQQTGFLSESDLMEICRCLEPRQSWRQALGLCSRMFASAMEPHQAAHDVMGVAIAVGETWKAAIGKMSVHSLDTSLFAFSALLSKLDFASLWQIVFASLPGIAAAGLRPDFICCNVVASACARNAKAQSAVSLLQGTAESPWP
eukprot:TRINITY_DN70257_c0_g1_i2.p1 TRINITY_DN70257_c0_g1~~TRINITY_DN70257_c0_g1_i2.p1  ORF type:complete len:375 (-),score=39.83 TRINITY_DN70257_c0_g1_i2:323-1447(-)